MRRAEKREKELEQPLKAALEAQADGKLLVTVGTEFQSIGYRQSGYGDFSEGIGTIRASAGKHGVSSQDLVVEPKLAKILDMTRANDVIRQCGVTCPTLQARMGTGGNQIPLVIEPKTFVKGTRPHSADEPQTWKQGDIANTLNTFDIGESRCNELIIEPAGVIFAIDRAAFNQGENAKYNFQIDKSGINSTIVAKGPSAVCYSIGIQPNNSITAGGLSEIIEKVATLSTTKQAAVCYNISGMDIAGTLDASYYKGCGVRSGLEREFVSVPAEIRDNLYVWIVRRLTPTECERLQGFPDDWTRFDTQEHELKDTPRYKALGNSIAIPCAERIFKGIVEVTEAERDVWI